MHSSSIIMKEASRWVLCAFLLSSALPGWVEAVSDCPSTCICHSIGILVETVTVDCHGRDLTTIPSPLPAHTTHLDLSNNLIQRVAASDFRNGSEGIIHLQLQNNDIQEIEPGAFEGLPSLETLFLYNNYQLTKLNGTFRGLGNLRRLVAYNIGLQCVTPQLVEPLTSVSEIDLDFNQLREIPTGTFANLPRLKDLSLSNNFITTLQMGSFSNLSALYYLSLRFNQLESLTDQSLQSLDRLVSLDLTGNPIQCTCVAMFLREFLIAQRLGGPRCMGPDMFINQHLLDVNPDEFCAPPTADIANRMPILVLLNGSDISLSCSVTGIPLPNVTWSRDGQVLESNLDRVTIVSNMLTISMAATEDSGEYHCAASSAAGFASSSQQVLVLAPPTIDSIERLSMQDAVLDCSSDPLPHATPTVWFFNGSRLAVTSERSMVLQNGSLLVRGVELEDMGVYMCQVGGQVNFTTNLTVSARPVIVQLSPEGPCDNPDMVRVDSTDLFTLSCSASGIPPPIVSLWQNNMRLAIVTPDPAMAGGVVRVEQFLGRLRQSTEFTCIANNSEGVVSRTISVQVRIIDQRRGNMSVISLTSLAGEVVVMDCPVQMEFDEGTISRWRRNDGIAIPFDTRASLTCNNRTLVLRMAVSTFDTALYECEIQEPSGRTYLGSVLLNVNERAVIDKRCGLPVVTTTIGTDAELPCPSIGSSEFDRTWFRDGTLIVADARTTISIATRGILAIRNVSVADSGVYTCVLTALPAQNMPVEQLLNDTYMIELVVTQPPEFVQLPANTSVREGDQAVMVCSGQGVPRPSITWSRVVDNMTQQINTDGQYFVTDHFLLIPRVFQRRDEGFYTCAINSVAGGNMSDPVFLNVLTPPTLSGRHRSRHRLKVGINATLTCSGMGDPPPLVSWLRLPGRTVLPMENSTNLVRDGNDLVILNVSTEDAGDYLCEVRNSVGVATFQVTVEVKAPPSAVVISDTLRVTVGCQATLRCLDGEMPPSFFEWRRNDDVIQSFGRFSISRNGTLSISDVRGADSGVYSCVVRTSLGISMAMALVTVQGGESPLINSSTPPTLMLAVHQVAQFVCLATGFPLPQVRWLRNGAPVPAFRRVVNVNESLRIRDLRTTDSGTYQCIANNTEGVATREFLLRVGVPPYIVRHPVAQMFSEGDDVTLVCTTTGDPLPDIAWFFNGEQITIPPDPHSNFTDPTRLRLTNLSARDSGLYTCRAQNFAGVATHSAMLTFRSPPLIRLQPATNTEVPLGGSLNIIADVVSNFTEPDGDFLFEGQQIEDCETRMNSTPCVFDDTFIMINEMDETKEGRYSVVANSSDGRTVASIVVSLVRDTIGPPQFLVSPQPQWVNNGSQFTLDCVATGNPPPNITWWRDGRPNSTLGAEFVQTSNNSLVVFPATPDTVGYFTCVADNGVSRSTSSAQVDLLFPVESTSGLSPPRLTQFPASRTTLFPGESLTVDCTASGSPAPSISWTWNGRPIGPDTTPSTVRVARNGSLVLTEVSVLEEGEYSCRATNEVGTTETAFYLEIEDGVISGTAGVSVPERLSMLSDSSVYVNCSVPDSAIRDGDWNFVWRHGDSVMCGGGSGRGSSLLINHLRMDQQGQYECQALSGNMLMKNTLKLEAVAKTEPPYFLVSPEDSHVIKRGFVILGCQAASPGGEETHLQWYRDHTLLLDQGVKHLVLSNGSLLLSNIYPAQAGNYSCEASNKYGRSLASAQVSVFKSEVDKFVNVERGSPLQLTCPLAGMEGGVKWVKDNRHSLSTVDGTVKIHSMDQSNAGEYTCSLKQHSYNYYVTMQVSPTILTPSQNLRIALGGVTSLDCLATGRPRPAVSWHHGSDLLVRGERHSILANGTLLLYRTRARDRGNYTCTAINTMGMAQRHSTLLVDG